MFVWCQRVLHFAEGVAYKRIQAARTAREFPEILDAVRSGDIHLTAVGLLAPKLTADNYPALISAARHLSADEIKRLLADREPKPAVPASVRRLPDPAKAIVRAAPPQHAVAKSVPPPAPSVPPAPRAKSEPLGAERYRVQFTAGHETHAELEELRALMRHQIPDVDVGKILVHAISVLLNQVRKRKFADAARPRPAPAPSNGPPSRHIPAAIRRAVWSRDAGRCTYVSEGGQRCESTDFIEFDHSDAWVHSISHSEQGIVLRCRAHNQLRARLDFGEQHMARFGRRTGSRSSSIRRPPDDPMITSRGGGRG